VRKNLDKTETLLAQARLKRDVSERGQPAGNHKETLTEQWNRIFRSEIPAYRILNDLQSHPAIYCQATNMASHRHVDLGVFNQLLAKVNQRREMTLAPEVAGTFHYLVV
jgi:hypothetical protein